MVTRFTFFVALLVLSGMSLMLSFQVVAGQTIGEQNETEASASVIVPISVQFHKITQ